MVRRPGNLRATVLRQLAPAVVLLTLVAVGSALYVQRRWELADLSRQRAQIQTAIHQTIAAEQELLELSAQKVLTDPEVVAAWADWRFDALLKVTQPIYARLQKHEVSHLYFIGADRRVQLRVHRPERRGDLIERESLARAAERGQPAVGLELGPLGTLTLRQVTPVLRGGRLLGYLELGSEIGHLAEHVEQALGLKLQVLARKERLERAQWERGLALTRRGGAWEALPEHVVLYGSQPASSELGALLQRVDRGEGPDLLARDALVLVPLTDLAGQQVADVAATVDFATHRAAYVAAIVPASIASLVIGAALFALFGRFMGRVDERLMAAAAAEEQLRGELEERVEARTDELIDQMALREHAEAKLRHVQKLEAIGRLTGGVAHDFNNLLTVIMGQLALVGLRAQNDGQRKAIEEALSAADRAAALTSRLLSFSRRQFLQPEPIALAELFDDLLTLLARTLGEQVQVETMAADGTWHCLADRGQLESALLNLGINARDAMADGGKLQVSARNATVTEERGALTPGEYVEITVRDAGAGMSPEVLSQVFEPFFTTKGVGEGSGLGLSVVHGFAQQSGGDVWIESAEGEGTAVTLLLPRAAAVGAERESGVWEQATEAGQGERILVVEDDALVRRVVLRGLKALGYRFVEAGDGESALAALEQHDDIDLLFTDVVLPGGMSGPKLAERVRERRPELPILFTSGYTEQQFGALEMDGLQVLQKPYKQSDLAEHLSKALRRSARGGATA